MGDVHRALFALLGLVVALVVAVEPAGAGSGTGANVKLCKGFQVAYGPSELPVFVRSDGTTFATYADCVTYAAHGGTVIRQTQFACESWGGEYVWHDFAPLPEPSLLHAVFTCNNFTVPQPITGNPIDHFGYCFADALSAGFSGEDLFWTVIDLVDGSNVVVCDAI